MHISVFFLLSRPILLGQTISSSVTGVLVDPSGALIPGADCTLTNQQRFLQFRTELFNGWNHTQFSGLDSGARFDPAGNQTNANFGSYTGARDPRIIQLSVKIFF